MDICMRHRANQLFNYTLWFQPVFRARFVSFYLFISLFLTLPLSLSLRLLQCLTSLCARQQQRQPTTTTTTTAIIYLVISSSFGYVNFIKYIADHRELLTGMKSRDDCFKNTCWFIWSVFIFSFVFTWIRWLVVRSEVLSLFSSFLAARVLNCIYS